MSENLNPKVSVIIPCYNNGTFVGETLESALAQTYKNLEIVCVNDGSTDNSADVIREYADKYKNIVFFDEKINRGVCYVRNMAIEACSGEYILPLDADDIIAPEYVEKAVKVLNERPEIGIVYCNADLFGSRQRDWKLPDFQKDKIIYENIIFCTSLFRKEDFKKVGGYKEYMNVGCEDWDLWLSFVENGFSAYRLDETLFHYRQHGNETRTDAARKYKLEIFKQIFNNHTQLYLNNDEFYECLLKGHTELRFRKKYKKYKNLFYTFLVVSIIELLFVLFLGGIF